MVTGPSDRLGRTRSVRGFTLLEVLAAVALLAIWFIVIAGSAMQGLRAEGISRRRLEAAMIADREMARLEASALDGKIPPIANDVTPDGDYTITVGVAAFAAPGGAPAAAAGLEDGGQGGDLQGLLAKEMPARVANLRTFDVRVAWQEGGAEQVVARTAFAFDVAGARQAYDQAGIAEPGPVPAADQTPTAAEEEQEP